MSEVAESQLGAQQLAGAWLRDPPTVVVTAPSGPQSTSTVTVTWTYASTLSKPQVTYRVQIRDQFGTVALYDSGAIPGTATSFDCPFTLSGGSSYQVRVECSDGSDVGAGVLAFSADADSVTDFPVNTDVGSVFEVAINGVGYRLADSPERPYRRSAGQLQPPRLATGDTPFSEAVERYSFVGVGDWSRGAGQRLAGRETSDARAFWSSENVNPFDDGVSLLRATEEILASAAGAKGAVVASGHLFAATAAGEVKRMTSPGATPDTMTFTGDTLVDLASDGTYWYALNTDDEIFRGTGTTIGSVWANLATPAAGSQIIEWCTDRLAVVYTNPAGQSVLSTIGPSGTEEVADGRFKFTNASITAVTAGDGYLWFSVNRTDRSVIYAWQLGSSDGAFIALDLPQGEAVTGLFHYLGNVMIRASRPGGAVIYRAVPSSGELIPERVLELSGAGAGAGPFTGFDRFVLFGWEDMSDDGRSGVGCIDLSSGGWCRWLRAAAANDNGAVTAAFAWGGLVGFMVDGHGVQLETTDTWEQTGYVTSSVSDLVSSLTKVIDEVAVTVDPLPADSSVTVSVSLDSLTSLSEVGSISVPGASEGRFVVGGQGPSVAVRVQLSTTGVLSPRLTMHQVKLHPLSVVDKVMELPISCADRQQGLNGVEIVGGSRGIDRARALEALVGTRVLLQDVDWPTSGVTSVWEAVGTDYTSAGVWERRTGTRREAVPVCVLTLRKAG